MKLQHFLHHFVQGISFSFFVAGEGEADVSEPLFLFGNFLTHIVVYFLQPERCVGIQAVELTGGFREEVVVEADDVFAAAPVRLERLFVRVPLTQLFFESVQQTPGAASPAIDALLDVAHDEIAAADGLVFEEQRLENLPLQRAGVLKLIDHHVVQFCTDFIEIKRGVRAFEQCGQKERRSCQIEALVLSVDFLNFPINSV